MPIGDTLKQQSQFYLNKIGNQSNPLAAMAQGAQTREQQLREFYLNKILNNLGFEKQRAMEMLRQQGNVGLENLRSQNTLGEIGARAKSEKDVRMSPQWIDPNVAKARETELGQQAGYGGALSSYATGNATPEQVGTLVSGLGGKAMSPQELEYIAGRTPTQEPKTYTLEQVSYLKANAQTPEEEQHWTDVYNDMLTSTTKKSKLGEARTLQEEYDYLIKDNLEIAKALTGVNITPNTQSTGTNLSGGGYSATGENRGEDFFSLGGRTETQRDYSIADAETRANLQQRLDENNRKINSLRKGLNSNFTGTADEWFAQQMQQQPTGGGDTIGTITSKYPPAQHKNWKLQDKRSGEWYQSDGTKWSPVTQ